MRAEGERTIRIYPSLLAADFANLGKDVAAAQGCGADGIHCDIMDGHFVPNITFGPLVVEAIRPLTPLPLYCHLMIEQPERYIKRFVEAGANEITVQVEACPHLHRVLQLISDAGARCGVAVNPSTSLAAIENVITDIDVLLIMTVNPGFGGQSFIESMIPKIARARRMADDAGVDLDIAVDGGIDVTTAPRVVRAGANLLIAGTAVFDNGTPVMEACTALRSSAEAAFDTGKV